MAEVKVWSAFFWSQVRFWYHMKGDDAGTIVVRQRTSYLTDTLPQMERITGSQGDSWHLMSMSVNNPGVDFEASQHLQKKFLRFGLQRKYFFM